MHCICVFIFCLNCPIWCIATYWSLAHRCIFFQKTTIITAQSISPPVRDGHRTLQLTDKNYSSDWKCLIPQGQYDFTELYYRISSRDVENYSGGSRKEWRFCKPLKNYIPPTFFIESSLFSQPTQYVVYYKNHEGNAVYGNNLICWIWVSHSGVAEAFIVC